MAKRLLITFLFFAILISTSAETDPLDVIALQALYGSLNHPPQLTGWKFEGGDPCGGESWIGVSCLGQSVVSINISGSGVGGFLGLRLSKFLSLKELDVSYNNIGGEIPFLLPHNATKINLAFNNFTMSIPYSLHFLKSLNYLNVSYNSLSGPIGNVFTDMWSLNEMDLSFNNFTGDLPSSFSSLTNLHALYLNDNQFTGSVNFLANLPLSVLDLENNHFSGFIPNQFEVIQELKIEGNMFQPGFVFPPPHRNQSTHSPLPVGGRNASTNPVAASSTSSYSSIQVGSHHQIRFGRVAMAAIVCGSLLMVLLAATFFVVQIQRCCNSKLDSFEDRKDSLPVLPVTAPKVSTAKVDQCPPDSPPRNSTRPPSFCHTKPEKMTRRKSCSRKSRSLPTAKSYSLSDLLVATKSFDEERLLGEGSIGRVYRAEFADGQTLAVKKINMVALAVYEEDEFLDAIWNISRVRHPNITSLLGYCVEEGEHILVFEFARYGSLDDALYSANYTRKALSWKARVRIAIGVAHALEHMHSICTPPLAHENIKATNILLDDELMPHISDFGLIALRHLIGTRSKTCELPIGCKGYDAPEISIPGIDKTKSDIYSFGVVLLELLTGRKAFDGSKRKAEQSLVKWASSRLHDFTSLEEMVDPVIKGTVSLKSLSRFVDVISLCIQPEPEYRAPMTEIVELLDRLVQRMCRHAKLSSVEACELDVSDLSFKTTLAYFEPSSPKFPQQQYSEF